MRINITICLLFVLTLVGSCATSVPKEALALRPEALELRQLQTRVFETTEEERLLTAGLGVLQDLGFNIDESESKLGVIVGSKQRSARDAGEIAGKVVLGALLGANVPWDNQQIIRVALVTRPHPESRTSVRVTFQRRIWNSNGQLSKIESIEDPEIYQEFFTRLSKGVFLEAHEI
ncbi:MAG TPA: hypothetical protein PLJ71_11020 [Candidatus Hydrogenedentes bacterium]|nr:hypothetical protein [Candidatus Hydrogenedentota bacterium]HQM49209.1 hypothetical protein [Candidatus Hydrogenedentota bacterium]